MADKGKKKGVVATTAASARATRVPGLKPSPNGKPAASLKLKKKKGAACPVEKKKTTKEAGPVKKKRRGKLSAVAKARKLREARRAKRAGQVEEDEESSEEDIKLPKGAPKPEKVMNSELNNEGLEWEAEKVVGSRLNAEGDREYHVKWIGWTSKHNTWEPAVNLVNSFDLITEFDEANPDAA